MEIQMEKIKAVMDGLDPAALLPDVSTMVGKVELAMRLAVLAGPILLLVLGLIYFFLPPREANHTFGYRCYFGMGSVEAWRYTQRLAGAVWAGLGLVLSVVMFFVCAGFRGKDVMALLSSAGISVLWEAGLLAVACLIINILVAVRFDKNGELRRKK